MALFFDQSWFDARLKARGAGRSDLASLLKLSDTQVGEIWKDQRELSARDVSLIAAFLAVSPEEIALRAGVSTPLPDEQVDLQSQLRRVDERLSRIEQALVELTRLLLQRRD